MSEKLFFYKREPGKFLGGIANMTVEQIAVYSVVLDMLYDKWETLEIRTPKQRRHVARTCGLSPRKFGTVLDELLESDKLQRQPSGRISNRKFEKLARERGVDLNYRVDNRTDKSTPADIIDGFSGGKTPENLKNALDNRRDNRTDNEAPGNDLKGLHPEKAPVHARVQLEVRSQKAEAEVPPAAPPVTTGFEQVHDILESDIRRICRALGVDMQVHPGAHNWPHQWVRLQHEKQITVDDMLEAIASYGQQPILRSMKSLFWLKDRCIEKRVARTLGAAIMGRSRAVTATDQAVVTDADWKERARMFTEYGAWAPSYGPSPLQPGCMMPIAMLDQAEQIWIAQGNHPAARQTTNGREPWKPGAGMTKEAAPFAPRSKA